MLQLIGKATIVVLSENLSEEIRSFIHGLFRL